VLRLRRFQLKHQIPWLVACRSIPVKMLALVSALRRVFVTCLANHQVCGGINLLRTKCPTSKESLFNGACDVEVWRESEGITSQNTMLGSLDFNLA